MKGKMEERHVHAVYNAIADHFDETRFAQWNGVVSFLQRFPKGSALLDIGCGNGKYLSTRMDCVMHACDPCEALVDIAKEKNPHATVIQANGMQLPYCDGMFRGAYSIAVLHHLSTMDGCYKFLEEMHRVMCDGSMGYITVWANEHQQRGRDKWTSLGGGDYLVPWQHKDGNTYMRYYHLFTKTEFVELLEQQFDIVDLTYECGNWQATIIKRA
jgi:ubiquinone/menaquinone biosynthesis C-methylase UbiE